MCEDSGNVTKEPASADAAVSALFGHKKGPSTGATPEEHTDLLRVVHNGILFLDGIGELGLGEQAMLLREIEGHRFLPVSSDMKPLAPK